MVSSMADRDMRKKSAWIHGGVNFAVSIWAVTAPRTCTREVGEGREEEDLFTSQCRLIEAELGRETGWRCHWRR